MSSCCATGPHAPTRLPSPQEAPEGPSVLTRPRGTGQADAAAREGRECRRVLVAVVGHVEWVEFVHGDHVPAAGEIVHASESFEEPAGGGAVAAVQLARMAGEAEVFTAPGDVELADRTFARLTELGVKADMAGRKGRTRRGF